jgi:hypothetical protein
MDFDPPHNVSTWIILVRRSSIGVTDGMVPAMDENSNQLRKKVFRARDEGKI